MKFKLTLFILCLISILIQAQEFELDYIIDPDYNPLKLKSGALPSNSTQLKYIRVNIHFILKDNGTGNFSETSDGINVANNYNGYMFAEDIIKACNELLSNNVEMRYQPSPPVEAIETNYKYILNGVFFHRSTSDYELSGQVGDACAFIMRAIVLSVNVGQAINIFFGKEYENSSCAALGGYVVNQHGHRTNYEAYLNSNKNWWYIAYIASRLNHEIGHNLSLLHTIRHGCGACCDNIPVIGECASGFCDDGCDDTPTWQEIYATGIPDPCCWNGCSNNLMDYSADVTTRALTPCQIDKVHEHIENFKVNYKSCSYISNVREIWSFTENQSYIAKKIEIPENKFIKVNNNNGLFINTEEFEINGEFEVELGSVLYVNTTLSCQ